MERKAYVQNYTSKSLKRLFKHTHTHKHWKAGETAQEIKYLLSKHGNQSSDSALKQNQAGMGAICNGSHRCQGGKDREPLGKLAN